MADPSLSNVKSTEGWVMHDDEQKRVLRPDQKEGVDLMIARFHRGEKASALFTSTGYANKE